VPYRFQRLSFFMSAIEVLSHVLDTSGYRSARSWARVGCELGLPRWAGSVVNWLTEISVISLLL
jgi:hypothetical protein